MKNIVKKISVIFYICLLYVMIYSKLYAIKTYDITRGVFEHVVYSLNTGIGENAEIITTIVIGYIFVLFIYWLVLLLKY